MSDAIQRKFVAIDGVRTHYLEAGDGPTVVLLHSGEFGGAAELSWEFTLPPLADQFRVVAPDWLGFGHTDKLHDFAPGGLFTRRIEHIRRFLEVLSIEEPDYVAHSMGGSFLIRVSAMEEPSLPIRRQVIISGGGFVPDNEYRRALEEYDCTLEGMRTIVRTMFHDPKWAGDEQYIQRRFEMSLVPGAWECSTAARLKPPNVTRHHVGPGVGASDDTPYERICVPTLLIAGELDPLREPGYAEELHRRIPGSSVVTVPNAGHCPHIENPQLVNEAILRFFTSDNQAMSTKA